ncbi:MAG: hypothetical protein H0W90_08040 [Actinobacteria bacterium]|nr:hypothetical protein [Actinomycetota bacterium]
MSEINQTPDGFSGVKVRKLKDGDRTWEISVASTGSSAAEMKVAADAAIALDVQLAEKFDPQPEETPVFRLGNAMTSANIEPEAD